MLEKYNTKQGIRKANELMKRTKCANHDWFHIERVMNNALKIKELLDEDIDENILKLAIAWHDISFTEHKPGILQYFLEGKRSAKIARKYLKDHPKIDLICDIIRHHPFEDLAFISKKFLNRNKSIYHQIIQDADSLDETVERFKDKSNLFIRYLLPIFLRYKKRNISKFLNLKQSLSLVMN